MMSSYLCIQITNKPPEIQLCALPQKSEVYLETYAAHLQVPSHKKHCSRFISF